MLMRTSGRVIAINSNEVIVFPWLVGSYILYSALVAVALLLSSSFLVIDILTVNFMTITVPFS